MADKYRLVTRSDFDGLVCAVAGVIARDATSAITAMGRRWARPRDAGGRSGMDI